MSVPQFRTRVITEGVVPHLYVDYKRSRIKQYHKEGRALRTKTVINDARDFGIGKRLVNLPALREVGAQANRRLLDVQRISHDPALGEAAFGRLTQPREVSGQRASALRFAGQRTQTLLSALVIFRLGPAGFTGADLRRLNRFRDSRRTNSVRAGSATSSGAPPPRAHRADPKEPPLSGHRARLPDRPLLHPRLRMKVSSPGRRCIV
jgi:hypothetical protein